MSSPTKSETLEKLSCFAKAALELVRVRSDTYVPRRYVSRTTFSRGSVTERLVAEQDHTMPIVSVPHTSFCGLTETKEAVQVLLDAGLIQVPQMFSAEGTEITPTAEEIIPAILRSDLLPLLVKYAEAVGGYEFNDASFEQLASRAIAGWRSEEVTVETTIPLIGLTAEVAPIDLPGGLRIEPFSDESKSDFWDEFLGHTIRGIDFAKCDFRIVHGRTMPKGESVAISPVESMVRDAIIALRLLHSGHIGALILVERCVEVGCAFRPS